MRDDGYSKWFSSNQHIINNIQCCGWTVQQHLPAVIWTLHRSAFTPHWNQLSGSDSLRSPAESIHTSDCSAVTDVKTERRAQSDALLPQLFTRKHKYRLQPTPTVCLPSASLCRCPRDAWRNKVTAKFKYAAKRTCSCSCGRCSSWWKFQISAPVYVQVSQSED